MKILSLHVDNISFKPLKKAIKNITPLSEAEKIGVHVKDALAILTAVEKSDSDTEKVVNELVKNVKEIAKSVGAKNIVLYPYAHLSSNLAPPEVAIEVLNKSEKELKKVKGFNVTKAPFGYYKEFELKVKGHPLAELSREIKINSKEDKVEEEIYNHKKLLREISKTKLDSSKLKKNDHRIIGKEMDLYSFSEVAPGMVFWHNNGLIIYDELSNYWKEVHRKNSYQIIKTPQILDSKLWKISGHWKLYKENMFLTEYENREFAVKPMNCPGGMLVYRNSPKSYKDFPLRIGELGIVHRKELSGVLGGALRVTQFTQDDAHIFCTENQLESEIVEAIKLTQTILSKFKFKRHRFTLSIRSKEKKDKYLGNDKIWNASEKAIENALKKLKIKYDKSPGEAKFYGPSLDVQIKDSLGREQQCSTIQLDMQLPERFGLEYTDKNNKKKTPLMLHRVIYGSLERFIGILIEHTNGRLPTWLSPVQIKILSLTDRNIKYCKEVMKKLGEEIPGLRIDSDFKNTPMQGKVKEAEVMKIPYIIVLGDREEKEKNMAVRTRGNKKIQKWSIDNFIKNLKEEIERKR